MGAPLPLLRAWPLPSLTVSSAVAAWANRPLSQAMRPIRGAFRSGGASAESHVLNDTSFTSSRRRIETPRPLSQNRCEARSTATVATRRHG